MQLISGITITTASGTSIVNSPGDSSLSIINSIKPLIELSEIDIKQVGPEFSFYGVDRTVPIAPGGSGLWTSAQGATIYTQGRLVLVRTAQQQQVNKTDPSRLFCVEFLLIVQIN